MGVICLSYNILMVAIFAYIQYFIKERFVYAMAIYTLTFIAVTTFFLKYKVNRRRNNNVRAAPTASCTISKPRISLHCNNLIFSRPSSNSSPKIAKSSDIYLITQVKSEEEEETVRRILYADPKMRKTVKEHVNRDIKIESDVLLNE
eukprot:TRINITY_DN9751_c0_g1_i8.p1 TRINITY_DN9751_c0_g1~~TRINITY_DN9751_c0_g1_i8.p1  ORF type:complete len:156 (-),score=12.31 TRINITY_DN9751_c0_g1_i8:142-582(-)